MNRELTEIVVVMDKSGSMAGCKKDAEQGLNYFINEQRLLPGRANFTLIEFDTYCRTVYSGVDIRDVGYVDLHPSGGTALLDALGRAIIDTGERLRRTPEAERPGLVVVVVVTDGEENSSREFSLTRIREMIEHQKTKYNWQFTYLGANHDAFTVAGSMGFSSGHTAFNNTNQYGSSFACNSNLVGNMRSLSKSGGDVTAACYNDQQRTAMVNPVVTVDNTTKGDKLENWKVNP